MSISNAQANRSYKYIVNGISGAWTANTTIDIENEGSWLPASGPMLAPFKRLQVITKTILQVALVTLLSYKYLY